MKKTLSNLLLPISLIVNGVLGTLLYVSKSSQAPAYRSTILPSQSPTVVMDDAGFDFSKTGLSDESWKVPSPDLKSPETTSLPTVDANFEVPTLKDTPVDWNKVLEKK